MVVGMESRTDRASAPARLSRGPDDAHQPRSDLPMPVYLGGRGALRRELTACLRSGRALRLPRARARRRGKSFLAEAIMISERPPENADRSVPSHWEGNLILGLGSSAIGTLVERTTRSTMLLHLPRMEGYRPGETVKNGPPLAGHGAEAVREAIAKSMTKLPDALRHSLTWDRGAEMPSMPGCVSIPGWPSTFAIRKARGSAAQTKTLMACCDSIFQKGPT